MILAHAYVVVVVRNHHPPVQNMFVALFPRRSHRELWQHIEAFFAGAAAAAAAAVADVASVALCDDSAKLLCSFSLRVVGVVVVLQRPQQYNSRSSSNSNNTSNSNTYNKKKSIIPWNT